MIDSSGSAVPEARELLVGHDADQDHRAHHREVERARDAEQVHQVLQDLQQDGAQHDAEDRALAARSEQPPSTAAAMA